MTADEAAEVVELLSRQQVIAHVTSTGRDRAGIRVPLPDGSEALWDVDGATGLEAMVMRDGVLVGFVPRIPGSGRFTPAQSAEAIASAKYEMG